MKTRRAADRLAMRREPVQDRSQARLDRIIAVTEALIVEKGLLGLNVREVARLADTNIATFYQFFPNRGSLTRRIVEIYNEKLGGALAAGLASVADVKDARTALTRLQEAMVRFYLDNPVALEIWPGIQADPVLRELDREDSVRNAAHLIPFIARLRPGAGAADVETAAILIVETAGTVFRHAVRQTPLRRKRVLAGYVDMVMGIIDAL